MKLKQILLFIVVLIVSCYLGFTAFAQPTTVGMVAYFPLNGNTTNLGSASVSATTVSTSYTTNSSNTANSAVQFGGNLNSYIDFVDNGNLDFSGTANFTVAFNFFFNGSTTSGLIDNCLNYGGWGIWLWSTVTNTWNLQFNYKNNSVGSAAGTNFSINQWHHVAAVRNNGTISLYIDGSLRLSAAEGTMTPTYPINMQAGAMCYGAYTPPRYNPFGGKIDEIRVYNRALSAAEIAILAPWSLPLKLGQFSAVKKSMGIQLNWETLSEINTSHFEIERSSDAIQYQSIGSVQAAGNSTQTLNYSFVDAQPLSKTNFYRLKMIDRDGAFSYSNVVVINNSLSTITLSLFPNPASDWLQVQLPVVRSGTVQISIIDNSGKQVSQHSLQAKEGLNATSIQVSTLPKGIYYVIVNDDEGHRTASFIKM